MVSTNAAMQQPFLEPELEWLAEVRQHVHLETMSVLFAKSVAEMTNSTKLIIGSTKEIPPSTRSVSMDRRKSRCIVRLTPTSLEAPESDHKAHNYKSLVAVAAVADEAPEPETSQFAASLPDAAMLRTNLAADHHSQCSTVRVQLRTPLNRRGRKKNVVYRHSIRVNDDTNTSGSFSTSQVPKILTSMQNNNKNISTSSSNLSCTSADSGQCSANSGTQCATEVMTASTMSDFTRDSLHSLPNYARVANAMDHILRVASTVLTLMDTNSDDPKLVREFVHKTKLYMEITRQSPCGPFLNDDDFQPVMQVIADLERRRFPDQIPVMPEYFGMHVRRMIEQSMLVFARVICTYINECVNKDRLLVIALEHFIHLLLFGDEILLEAIKAESTPPETLRLVIRATAVLCGVNKGCIQLLSIGGLDVVVDLICNAPTPCAVESAGILTQLTSPSHPMLRSTAHVEVTVPRLLQLLDESNTLEAVLLCAAALANLSVHARVTELLYQRNAVLRLVKACDRPNCASAFVYEQAVTIFSRLAVSGHDQVLIAQKAIPLLFNMLTYTGTGRMDYHRRVRYKAVVCLSTIAATGIGLRALYDCQGYHRLNEVLRREGKLNSQTAPFSLLCASICHKLETTYYATDKTTTET